jgi:hypothetical protein
VERTRRGPEKMAKGNAKPQVSGEEKGRVMGIKSYSSRCRSEEAPVPVPEFLSDGDSAS